MEVEINHVGGSKIGSFEVFCKDINLFSKLSLGYFPHIKLLAERIENFMQDVEKGNDLTSYKECNSPVRRKSNIKRSGSVSPVKPTTIKTYNG